MNLCWLGIHKYGLWSTPEDSQYVDSIKVTCYLFDGFDHDQAVKLSTFRVSLQTRACSSCGKIQQRKI